MRRRGRLLDESGDGPWNMAVDQYLLDAVEPDEVYLRFYGWSEPTLSLGYFQRASQRRMHSASLECPMVRRPSGGGAILHDRELTYSLIVGQRAWRGGHQQLYHLVHASLVEALAQWNLVCHLAADNVATKGDEEIFLCFQRRSAGDVLLGEHKIAGSAQRRRAGAILQHGSVLLARSGRAPELPGLAELAGRAPQRDELAAVWREQLARCLDRTWDPDVLSAAERQACGDIVRQRYAAEAWNRKRD